MGDRMDRKPRRAPRDRGFGVFGTGESYFRLWWDR
jgi:hypothetical protein